MGRDFSYMTKNAVDTEIVDRHAPTEFCRWIGSNFNHGKLVRSNVLEETSHLPGHQAFPLSQVGSVSEGTDFGQKKNLNQRVYWFMV